MAFLKDIAGSKESHEFVKIFTEDKYTVACRVCGSRWKRKPNHGRCTGCRIYDKWSEVPNGLVSKTKMTREFKRDLPENTLPFAVVRTKSGSGFIPVYPIVAGEPKRCINKGVTYEKT